MASDSIQIGPWLTTTRWSLIGRAGEQDEATRRAALDELLRSYLAPLKAHLVLKRHLTFHAAEDVLQEFVAQKILHRDLLSTASPFKGRFRTLLLTSLDRFVIDQHRAAVARRQDRTCSLNDIEGRQCCEERAAASDPDVFEVAWARTVLLMALARMKAECKASGRNEVWGVFCHRVLAPLLNPEEELNYAQLVHKFQLKSAAQASNVLMTGKRQFNRIFMAVVCEFLHEGEDLNEALTQLRKALASPGAVEYALRVFLERTGPSMAGAFDHAESKKLARLLDEHEPCATWKVSELGVMLRHQLNARLHEMLAARSPSLDSKLAVTLAQTRPTIKTLWDLLHHPHPPRELLRMVKRWAEQVDARGESPLPKPLADSLRICAEAVAVLRHGRPLGDISNVHFCRALTELAGQPWISSSERKLLEDAQAWLEEVR